MCGFVGYLSTDATGKTDRHTFEEMTSIITHRGPDDVGYYYDNHIHLGFRRLSIIDVESGKQPLIYDNRYIIIFNGEIYNYLELKKDLENKGYKFNTNSDTEVIVALYSHMGSAVVNELRGMFGFLIWDMEKQELFGARDHFGIKPFFYYEDEKDFYCSSEKKSILLALDGKENINLEAVHHYLTYQYVPEPSTMTKDVNKLEPGCFFTKKIGSPMKIQRYFKPMFSSSQRPFSKEVENIRSVLRDSVKMHLRSDVPVGAFLSGGIDSTSIVALAKELHPSLKTFTVGFERQGFSEIDLAKQTAEEIGVENISYVVKPDEFIQELPKIIWHLDDPVADPALVPLYFVAREARKHVKVVLSGEGADELFGGYNIYREPHSLKYFKYVPQSLKSQWNMLAGKLPDGTRGKSFIERGTTPLQERYIGNAKIFNETEKRQLLRNYHSEWNFRKITEDVYGQVDHLHDIQKMQMIDIHTWLRGDILVKADRMTMANSLELRVPFLDKEVFNVASQLKHPFTVTNKQTKYILRKAMEGIIPDSALNRRKLGFPVPIRHWLKKELYDWAHQLILESETDYLFEKNFLISLLEDHKKGLADHSRRIWTVLTFMIWHQIYVERKYNFDDFISPQKSLQLN